MARIVCFGSDLTDVAQLRRLGSFHELGHEVISVTSRKGPMPEVAWQNIDLGQIGQHGLMKRAALALKAALADPRLAPIVASADVLVARNLDMLALACVVKRRSKSTAPIAYEVLDIHSLLEGDGAKSRLARLAERRLLQSVSALWLSSPGFHRGYFSNRQGYDGPWYLVENKLVLADDVRRPDPVADSRDAGVIRLGWIGAIRCRPSFELLLETAKRMGGAVELHIHGQIHDHVLPDFHDRIADVAQVMFHGAYAYPDGLAACYGSCDVVWAQDLWQAGGNSDLLLPNRIYEAGWHNCPVIALSGTETGRKIAQTGQGWTIDAATPDALISCLSALDQQAIKACSQAIAAIPDAVFRQTEADVTGLLGSVGIPARSHRAP